jgi:hypothetical protein
MKLPNKANAVVDIAKLRDYCLNPEHQDGKHKARVFKAALGLSPKDAEKLCEMILQAVETNDAEQTSTTPFGERFVVDFVVKSLRGDVQVRSAWMIRHDENFPRLTSCYIL